MPIKHRRQVVLAVLLVISLSAATPLAAAPSGGDDGNVGIAARVLRVVKRVVRAIRVITPSDDIGLPHP
jgi:hypothetical protein